MKNLSFELLSSLGKGEILLVQAEDGVVETRKRMQQAQEGMGLYVHGFISYHVP